MWILNVILTIAVGLGLAWYGLRYYSAALAAAVLTMPVYSASLEINSTPIITLVIGLVLAVLVYFLSKPFTYLLSFGFIQLIALLAGSVALGSEWSGTVFLGSIVIALVATILLRKQLKPILVGLYSGSLVGVGVSTIVAIVFAAGSIASLATFNPTVIISMLTGTLLVPTLIYFAVTIGGVVFQYQYILKHNPELIQSGKTATYEASASTSQPQSG